MSALDTEPFPRGALIAAAALIGLSLASTAYVRLARLNAPAAATSAAVAAPARSIQLHFLDQANGSVSVRDARSNAVVATLAPGEDGFIRSVMRGLAHERTRRGIGPEQPFVVAQWASGRLELQDAATGRMIDLDAFGVTNKDAFARLLPGAVMTPVPLDERS